MADNNPKPGWKVWRFDQMATNVNVRIDNPSESGMAHYVGLEHLDSDSLKIRRWGTPDDVEATKLMFKKGDIIFGRRRAYQRKLGVAEFAGICSAHAMVLRAKPEVVLPEFLPFFMQSDLFMNRAVEISVGSLSPTINWKTMAVQEFALPPIDEQRRMLDLLLAVEDEMDALTTALKVGNETEKVFFAHAIRGSLSSDAQHTQDSRFGPVPRSWSIVPISQIADVAYGISESVASNKDPSIGWPILTGANITLEGTLDFAKTVYIAPPTKEGFILRKGDLLLNWRSGSEEHVGKTAIFESDQSYTYASFVLRIRPGERMNRRLLWRLLNHMREFRLFGSSTSQQVNFKMNAAVFRDVELICPPRNVQDEIVNLLASQWAVLASLAERREKTRALKQRALEGVI